MKLKAGFPWKPAARPPVPLPCLLQPPLKHCRGLAALPDRVKTDTSAHIPISSYLRRLNAVFPCFTLLGFSSPCFFFFYISYKKKKKELLSN